MSEKSDFWSFLTGPLLTFFSFFCAMVRSVSQPLFTINLFHGYLPIIHL